MFSPQPRRKYVAKLENMYMTEGWQRWLQRFSQAEFKKQTNKKNLWDWEKFKLSWAEHPEWKTGRSNVPKACVFVCFPVESMFSAMCECQALHPDPEDEDSDNDFEGEEYDLEGAGMEKNFK